MIQRVLIASCLIVTLASLSLLGLVWHQSNQAVNAAADATRRLAQAQAANQARTIELLTRTQSTSVEMLKQLQTMAQAARSPRAPDWIPVTFKLTLETPGGPPAVGYQATLVKGSAGLFEQGIRRESDSGGLVDFGVVQPGDWEFELSRSLDDQHIWKCHGNINVLPGTSIAKTIVCPGPRQPQSRVRLRVEWPADLAGKDLRMAVTFVQTPSTIQPSLKWRVIDSLGFDRCRTIVFGPGMKQSEIGGATKLELWYVVNSDAFGSPYSQGGTERVFGDFHSQNVRPESDAVAMELGSFLPRRLIVLRPCARQNSPKKGERLEVLAHTEASEVRAWDVKAYAGDPDNGQNPLGTEFTLAIFKGAVTVAPSYWRQLEGRFSVRPGQVNDWTLSLPAELIDAVRKRLEGKEDPKAEQPRAQLGVGLSVN